jgi:hypothetical protein
VAVAQTVLTRVERKGPDALAAILEVDELRQPVDRGLAGPVRAQAMQSEHSAGRSSHGLSALQRWTWIITHDVQRIVTGEVDPEAARRLSIAWMGRNVPFTFTSCI